jgi:hypothetical protein
VKQDNHSYIDYIGNYIEAFRSSVFSYVRDFAAGGLPGQHYFALTFITDHEDVILPNFIKAKYPEMIKIVFQNFYEDLSLFGDNIYVRCKFSNVWHDVVIPLESIVRYEDPSVNYAWDISAMLRPRNDVPQIEAPKTTAEPETPKQEGDGATVINLADWKSKRVVQQPSSDPPRAA